MALGLTGCVALAGIAFATASSSAEVAADPDYGVLDCQSPARVSSAPLYVEGAVSELDVVATVEDFFAADMFGIGRTGLRIDESRVSKGGPGGDVRITDPSGRIVLVVAMRRSDSTGWRVGEWAKCG